MCVRFRIDPPFVYLFAVMRAAGKAGSEGRSPHGSELLMTVALADPPVHAPGLAWLVLHASLQP